MFSYTEYKNIINLIRNHLPIIDFSDVTKDTKKFCVLRHDIEFSIDRAYELAKVEKELGVISMLEYYYGFYIDRFAFHRPKKEYLKEYFQLDGKINCYDRKYFQYFDEKPDELDVLYLADSNHEWKYGYPLDFDFSKVDKLQLLTHPYSWTEHGGDNYRNFLSLIRERNNELSHSMNTETNTFPKELLQ
jgi:hypothetical protein